MVQNGREPFSAASAIWRNREALTDALPRLRSVRDALLVASEGPKGFIHSQWLQILSVVYDFKPDLIIELGRGYGNSTCVMATAARMLAPQPCRILSLCLSNSFQEVSRPQLADRFPGLFDAVDTEICDILGRDFGADLGDAKRVFVFWDAHGYELAQDLLGGLFRLLQDRTHLCVMHDLADLKYLGPDFRRHDSAGKWATLGSAPPKYILGDFGAQYEEGIALVDFADRNHLPIRSAEASYFTELTAGQLAELEERFGGDFSRYGFWYSFSLNDRGSAELTFPERPEPPPPPPPPALEPEPPPPPPPPKRGLLSWLKRA